MERFDDHDKDRYEIDQQSRLFDQENSNSK
jgi:hypothetical protein